MKKIFTFLMLLLIMVSCYDEYVVDYDYDGVYFPNSLNVRTVVVGEGLKIKVGAQLGGTLKNTRDRIVNFKIDGSLITPDVLTEMQNHPWPSIKDPTSEIDSEVGITLLPSDYYTLSNSNQIEIKKGWHSGNVTLTVDSAKFLNQSTLKPIYAVPFYITSADADTIVESLRSTIIALKYENKFFGNYLHGGVTVKKDNSGSVVETISYSADVNQADRDLMVLTTVAPHELLTNGYSRTRSDVDRIKLTMNGDNITISSAPGSAINFLADGTSSFNGAKLLQERKLFLNYKYTDGGFTYHSTDTLYFRNRIRDGINEWQDENPENYK